MGDRITELSNRIADVHREQCDINARLNRGLKNLENLEKNFSYTSEVPSIKERIVSIQNSVADLRNIILSNQNKMEEALRKNHEKVENSREELQEIRGQGEMYSSSIFSEIGDIDIRLKALEDGLCMQVAKVSEDVSNKIEKLRKEITVSPKETFDQNQKFHQQMEAAQMDATNAMSKVNNMDLNIRILDKKIENLAIQIKRLELKLQE